MKKQVLFIFSIVFTFQSIISQVVFCPPGAEWHSLFIQSNLSNSPTFWNERIYYSGDSILGLDTLKILKHTKFFVRINPSTTKLTLVKQKGDTIFIRNIRTNHTWQVLYNFNVTSGNSWTFNTLDTQTLTTTFLVDSVKNVLINSIPLKQIYLKINGSNEIITERLGCNLFLFPFYFNVNTDGDYLFSNLCYSDNTMGNYKFGQYSCDVQSILNTKKLNLEFKGLVYPNPTNGLLAIEVENANNFKEIEIKLLDAVGRASTPLSATTKTGKEIDLSPLPKGIYFLQVWDKGKLLALEKVMKE